MLVLVGAALVAGGLALGLMPVRADGVACGSAFRASSAGRGLFAEPACDGPRSMWRVPAVALLAAGGVLAVGGAVVAGAQAQDRRP